MKCIRFGSEYGGWPVIIDDLNRDSIVYSGGIEEDNTFGMALIKTFGMIVHAFDPTPNTLWWIQNQILPAKYVFHSYGMYGQDGNIKMYPLSGGEAAYTTIEVPDTKDRVIEVELKKLSTIMEELGHDRIDVLKIDIEGSEYAVLDEIVEKGIDVQQILVEFHPQIWHKYTQEDTDDVIKELEDMGYHCFHVKGGEYCFYKGEVEKVFQDHEVEYIGMD